MTTKFCLCLLVSLVFVGCSADRPRRNADDGWPRFVPVNVETFGGGLALDTKTGQLCRTWNLQLNFEVVKETPLCKALYDANKSK
jgi:hypothetical protein